MNTKVLFIRFLLCLSIFFLFSCVGKQQYDDAMKLQTAGKSMEAIQLLKEAVSLEPDNMEYRQALEKIQNELIKKYIDLGRSRVTMVSPLSITAIFEAKSDLGKAKAVSANHPLILAFESDLMKMEENIRAESERNLTGAQEAVRNGDWYKAFLFVQEIEKAHPHFKNSSELLTRIRQEGVERLLGDARKIFDDEDYKKSIAELRKVVSMDPGHRQATELLQLATQRDSKGYFIDQGHKAVTEKRWHLALKRFQAALNYDPSDKKLQELITKAREQAGHFYINTARAQMNEGWLYRAIESYRYAVENAPSGQNDAQLTALRYDLANRVKAAAETLKNQKNHGAAWYLMSQIQDLVKSDQDIANSLQDLNDLLVKRVTKSIAIFDFSSPSDNKDAGIIVANNLITHIFKNASRDIKILERERLKSILEELKLGQIGMISETATKEMGRMFGIDVAIMGSVLLYKVDTARSDGTKTARYQTGTIIKDNIDFLNWRSRNPNADALAMQYAPPAKIEAPQYAEKDYRVEHVKKIAFVNASFRIVDVNTGENIQVRSVEKKKTIEDDASAGLPEAGIKFDSLDVPTDTELLQSLTNELVAEMVKEVLLPLSSLEKTQFQSGVDLLQRRKGLQAGEAFVNALFTERLKGINNMKDKTEEQLREVFRGYNDNVGM